MSYDRFEFLNTQFRRTGRAVALAGGRSRLVSAALAMTLCVTPALAQRNGIEITPQQGQTDSQLRRDRYECHNWAVDQTGEEPVLSDPAEDRRQARSERGQKALLGAAIGAAIGGVFRGSRAEPGRRGNGEAADGAIGGAVIGAVAGAIAGRRSRDREQEEPALESDYQRALGACLEGRGYSVAASSIAASANR